MGKKKRENKNPLDDFEVVDRINAALARMNHRELKKECIQKGMEFEKLLGASHHELASFFYNNFDVGGNPNLLTEFDAFLEPMINDPVLKHSALKYGFVTDEKIAEYKDRPQVKPDIKKVEKIEDKKKEVKAAGVNEDTGVRKGTKKDMTYTLAQKGESLINVQKLVMKAFPEANLKSIKIWYGRAVK